MGRKAAREALFKLVYEYTVRREEDDFTRALLSSPFSEEDADYISKAYKGILSVADELIGTISGYSHGFAADRIYKIDLAILMVAIYEIRYIDDIPDSVSANEAVELAKKYSTDKSCSFVNGILASVIKEKKNSEC